jgi:hypothetical protein
MMRAGKSTLVTVAADTVKPGADVMIFFQFRQNFWGKNWRF